MDKKYLIALISNLAYDNKENYIGGGKNYKNDSTLSTLKNNLKNTLKTIKDNAEWLYKDIEGSIEESKIRIIRNYFSHTNTYKNYDANKDKYNSFEQDSWFLNFKKLIDEFLNLKYLNINDEKFNLTNEVYSMIYLSMFLTRSQYNLIIDNLDKIDNWKENEEKTIDLIFNTKKNKLTCLRLWLGPSVKTKSYENKIRLVQNIQNHLQFGGKYQVKINKFNCIVANELLYNSIYKFQHIYNQDIQDNDINPWSSKKSNFFKNNYVLLKNTEYKKQYKLLTFASFRYFLIDLLDKTNSDREFQIDKWIKKILNDEKYKIKRQTKKTQISSNKKILLNHFKNGKAFEEKPIKRSNIIASLKLLNKILLCESNIKNSTGDIEDKKASLSKLAPSRNQFFMLVHYIQNNKPKYAKELYEKLYSAKDGSMKIHFGGDNVLLQINEFLYKYIENYHDDLKEYTNNKKWKNQTKDVFKNGLKIAGKEYDKDFFQNKLANNMLEYKTQKPSGLNKEITEYMSINTPGFNIIKQWHITIKCVEYITNNKNNIHLQSTDIYEAKEFKSLAEKSIKEYLDRYLGKVYVPKELLNDDLPANIMSNYHIFKNPLYERIKKIFEVYESKRTALQFCKIYIEKELHIIKEAIEKETQNKDIRDIILHRFNKIEKRKPEFINSSKYKKVFEFINNVIECN